MDSATKDLYLQKMEEFIYDENKIVTCTWLSKELGISVSDAESLMKEYVGDVRQTKPNDLSVTYVLLGVKGGKDLVITLSKESELQEKIATHQSVTSQHIYSVQKLKDLDLSVLSLVDSFTSNCLRDKPLSGSVTGRNCVKRALKVQKFMPMQNVMPSFFTKAHSTGQVKEEINENMLHTKLENAPNKERKDKQTPNGIASFFSKAQSEGDIKTKKARHNSSNGKFKQNEMMGKFFSKVSVKLDKKEVNDDKAEIENVTCVIDNKSILATDVEDEPAKVESEIENVGGEDDSSASKNEAKECAKQIWKPKRSLKNNKSSRPQKKRKRIVVQNGSDSDDIFGDDDDKKEKENENWKRLALPSTEDLYLNSDDEEFEPIYEKPVNKKRKQVARTFTDEDGYVVTQKEWMVESGSDSEVEQQKSVQHCAVPMDTVEAEMIDKSNREVETENKIEEKLSEAKNGREVLQAKVVKKKAKTDKKEKPQQTLLDFFKRT